MKIPTRVNILNISAWAVRNPTPILLLFFLLVVLGVGGYRSLGANEWPDVDFPTVVVEIDQPGASPAELETEVAKKVEDALTGIANLDHVRSTITEGHSATVVEFELGTNTQTALNDVRDAVSRIRQLLPGEIQEPVILHPNNAGDPFITYTIASPTRGVAGLSRLVDEDVTRALLSVPGVSSIQRAGGYKREVTIALDAARLRAVGLTVDAVNNQLKTINVNLPGGRGEVGGGEQGIRALGGARSVDELRARALVLPTGGTARLDTLGTVTDGYQEVRQIARLDGQAVVGFSVVRASGSTLVETESKVRAEIERLGKTLPPDVKLTMIRSLTKLGAVGAGKPVKLILRGTDPAALAEVAAKQLAEMRVIPGLRDVTSTLAEEKPEIRIVPRSQAAAEQGVSVTTIGRMARLATMGDVDFSLAKFKDGDEQIAIRVKVQGDVRRDLTAIGDVLVPGKSGLVPLRSVADIELGFGPVQLNRYDRARQVTFSANLGDLPLGTAMERVLGTPTMNALPATVTPDTLGESQIMADIFAGFMASVGLGVFLIYAVLVLLFGGFLHPLTIMGALPLSIGGALAGLLLGGKELGMMALVVVPAAFTLVDDLREFLVGLVRRFTGNHEATPAPDLSPHA